MQPGLRLVNLWSMIWTMKMKTGSRNSTLKENLYHPKSMSLLTFDMLMLHMQPNYFGIIWQQATKQINMTCYARTNRFLLLVEPIKSVFLVEIKGIFLIYACRLEMMLFKLEIMDHKARERAGLIIPTFSAPIPIVLKPDSAMEVNTLTFTCYELVYLCLVKQSITSKFLEGITINSEICYYFQNIYILRLILMMVFLVPSHILPKWATL